MRSRPRLRLLPSAGVFVLASALPISGCGEKGSDPAMTRGPLGVQARPVEKVTFRDVVETVSTLEAIDEVALAAQAGGRIQELRVQQGDLVQPGQLLLVLDQAQARADVARLKAEVETDRLNFQRFDFLAKQGAASAIQRDELRQRYVASREQLIASEADLGFRDLRAPIGGTIGDVNVKVGDVISSGQSFTSIIRNNRLLARVEVPAIFSSRLRPGLTVVLMDPASGRPLAQAPVRSTDPGVRSNTQTLLVKAEFDNAGKTLRTGLRSRTQLILDERQQPSVPFAAVTQISGQRFVFVAGSLAELEKRPGQVQLEPLGKLPPGTRFALQTPVELGPLQNNRYPVLRGLQPGQLVITSNLINLRHGLPVKVN